MKVSAWIFTQVKDNPGCAKLLGLRDFIFQLIGDPRGKLYYLNIGNMILRDIVHKDVRNGNLRSHHVDGQGLLSRGATYRNGNIRTSFPLDKCAYSGNIFAGRAFAIDGDNDISMLKAGLFSWRARNRRCYDEVFCLRVLFKVDADAGKCTAQLLIFRLDILRCQEAGVPFIAKDIQHCLD